MATTKTNVFVSPLKGGSRKGRMKPTTYVRRVGRSMGYIAYDVLNEFSPAVVGMVKDTKELSGDLYQSIKEIKIADKAKEANPLGKIKDTGRETWSNFKADWKSGNWYNKERLSAAEEKKFQQLSEMWGGDEDLNFDFNFDDDFGDDGFSAPSSNDDEDMSMSFDDSFFDVDADEPMDPTKKSTEAIVGTVRKQIASNIVGTEYLAGNINTSANRIANTSIASTEYLAAVQKESTSLLGSVFESGNAKIVEQLISVNSGVAAIAQLVEPMATHLQNSQVFYTKSGEFQDKLLELVTKISENTAPPTDTRFKSSKSYKTIDDMVTMDGGFDIKNYVEMLKENLNEFKEQNSGIIDMAKMMFSGQGGEFVAAPVYTAASYIFKNMIMPEDFKRTARSFNNQIGDFTKAMFGRLMNKDMGFIGEMLKDFILPKDMFKDKLSPSNYMKGRVDWDGKSRKALMEVIPFQLSQMVSALTGQEQKIFDYDKGTWVRVGTVQRDFDEMKGRASRVGYDYENLLEDTMSKMVEANRLTNDQMKSVQEQFRNYLKVALTERNDEFANINENDFNYSRYGLDKETWEFIKQFNKSIKSNEKYDQKGLYANLVSEMFSARNSFGRQMRSLDEDGNSIYNMLFNGSIVDNIQEKKDLEKAGIKEVKQTISLGTDKYKNDLWYYLQNMYLHTKHISDNIEWLGRGGGGSPVPPDGGPSGTSPIDSNHRLTVVPLSHINMNPTGQHERTRVEEEMATRANSMSGFSMDISSLNAVTDQVLAKHDQKEIPWEKLRLTQEERDYKAERDAAIAAGEDFEGKRDKDMDRRIAEKEKAAELYGTTIDKVNEHFLTQTANEFKSSLSKIIGKPLVIMSRYMQAAQNSMNKAIFGDDGSKGLLDTFREDMQSDFFRPIHDAIDQAFAPLRGIFRGISKVLFGEKDEEGNYHGGPLDWLGNATIGNLGKAKKWVKDIFFHDGNIDKEEQEENPNGLPRDFGTNQAMAFENGLVNTAGHQEEIAARRMNQDDYADRAAANGWATNLGDEYFRNAQRVRRGFSNINERYGSYIYTIANAYADSNNISSDEKTKLIEYVQNTDFSNIAGILPDDNQRSVRGKTIKALKDYLLVLRYPAINNPEALEREAQEDQIIQNQLDGESDEIIRESIADAISIDSGNRDGFIADFVHAFSDETEQRIRSLYEVMLQEIEREDDELYQNIQMAIRNSSNSRYNNEELRQNPEGYRISIGSDNRADWRSYLHEDQREIEPDEDIPIYMSYADFENENDIEPDEDIPIYMSYADFENENDIEPNEDIPIYMSYADFENENDEEDIGQQSANGRKITRSGIASVSEGEMIIPAELNPFYHKKIDKRKQIRTETENTNKFFGNFADGAANVGATMTFEEYMALNDKAKNKLLVGEEEASTNEAKEAIERMKEYASNLTPDELKEWLQGRGIIRKDDEGLSRGIQADNRAREKGKQIAKSITTVSDAVNNVAETVGNTIKDTVVGTINFLRSPLGTGGIEKKEKEGVVNSLKQISKSIFKTGKTKDNIANSVSGAIIGGGASILTGAIIGPVAGAVIGGAVGMLAKSKELQEALFGTTSENNEGEEEYKPGILGKHGKKIKEFIDKHVSSSAKGGAIGTAAGLFLGSPFLGAIVGSGIGYIKTSDKIKDLLFGPEMDGERTGGKLISKNMMKKLQSIYPNIATGALLMAPLGPFGLAGNLILGSAMGYASSTDKFKTWLFGETDENGKRNKGEGSFVGLLKKNLLDPLVGIFDSLAEGIRVTVRDTFHNLAKTLRKVIIRNLSVAFHPLTRFLSKTVGKVAGLLGWSTGVVGKGLTWVDTKLKNNALKKGRQIKDREKGRMMTSKERTAKRQELGLTTEGDAIATVEKIMADTTTESGMLKIQDALNIARDPGKEFQKQEINSRTAALNITGSYENYLKNDHKDQYKANKKTFKELDKAIRSGDYTKVNKILEDNPDLMNQNKMELLRAQLGKAEENNRDFTLAQKDSKAALEKIFKNAGFSDEVISDLVKLTDSQIARLLDTSVNDLKNRDDLVKMSEEEAKAREDEMHESVVNRIPDMLREIIDALTGRWHEATEHIEEGAEDEEIQESASDKLEHVEGEIVGEDDVDNLFRSIKEDSEDIADNLYYDRIEEAITKRANKRKEEMEREKIMKESADTDVVDYKEVEAKEGDTRTNGNGEKEIFNDGEWVVDTSNTETKKKIGLKEKFMNTIITHVPFISSIATGFNFIKEKLFGKKEDGDKEDNLFTKIIKAVPKIVAGAVPIILMGLGLSGKLDNFFEGILDRIPFLKGTGAGKDTTKKTDKNGVGLVIDPETGEPKVNEDGKYENENGEEIDPSSMRVLGTNATVSAQLWKNTIGGVFTGSSLLTRTLKKSKLVKGGVAIAKGTANVAKGTASNLAPFVKMLGGVLGKLGTALTKIPGIGKYFGSIGIFFNHLLEKIPGLLKGAGGKVTKILGPIMGKIGQLALPVYIATYAIDGWGEAEKNFGVLDATIGQRVISAVVAAINAAIPGFGNLIPNKVIIKLFIEVADKMGFSSEEFKKQQEEAQKELELYNKDNGTELTMDQYLDMKGKSGVISKIKHTGSKFITNVKNAGFGSALKGLGSDAIGLVKNSTTDLAKGVAKGALSAGKWIDSKVGVSSLLEKMKAGDVKGLLADKTPVPEGEEGGQAGLVSKIVHDVTKVMLIGPTNIIGAVKSIGEGFKKVIGWFKDVAIFAQKSQAEGKEIFLNGELSDLTKDINPPEGPFQGILKGIGFTNRMFALPPLVIKRIGKGIADFFTPIIDTIKGGIGNLTEGSKTIWGYVLHGDEDGEFSALGKIILHHVPKEDSGPFGWITNAILDMEKLFAVPVGMVFGLGRTIGKFVGGLIEKIKSGAANISRGSSEMWNITKTARTTEDYNKLLTYSMEQDPDNPHGAIVSTILSIEKIFLGAVAPLSMGFHMIGDAIKYLVEPIPKDWENIKSIQTEAWKYALNGEVSKAINMSSTFKPSPNNILGAFFAGGAAIMTVVNSIVAVISKVFGWVGKLIGGIKDTVVGWAIGEEKVDEYGNTYREGGLLNTAWNRLQTWLKGGKPNDVTTEAVQQSAANRQDYFNEESSGGSTRHRSSNKKARSGGNSGFVSQLDPEYSNRPIGNSTVGRMGCGPAAAAMALNAYSGRGTGMDDAINMAQGYQTEGGTDISYFGDYFAKNGVQANYMNNQEDIMSSITGGSPTILMGKDPSNTSKRNSPFGPNNHYVVANGFDKRGNVVVNDPEAKRTRTYSPKILRNVTMGVGAGAAGLGMAKMAGTMNRMVNKMPVTYSHEVRDDRVTRAIWGFFRFRGYSEAATAGIMGNMQSESGIDPTRHQIKGTAQGICQWEGDRFDALKSYCESKGVDWTDLLGQLEFVDYELQNTLDAFFRKNTSVSSGAEFKKETDVRQATIDFEEAFERAGVKAWDKRAAFAQQYYEMFTGKMYLGPSYGSLPQNNVPMSSSEAANVGGVGGDISNATGETENSSGSVLDEIIGLFSSAFTKIFSRKKDDPSAAPTMSSESSLRQVSANPNGMAWSGKTPVQILQSIAGKVTYSQNGPRDPSQGSADCSSTVNWAIKKAGGPDIGGFTGSQYNSPNLDTVWYNGGMSSGSLPENIQPNDVLFFKRKSSNNKDGVGHVELYMGNGMMIGHGSGMGPKERKVSTSDLIKVSRVRGLEQATSGNTNKYATAKEQLMAEREEDLNGRAAAGSGLAGMHRFMNKNRDKILKKAATVKRPQLGGGTSGLGQKLYDMISTDITTDGSVPVSAKTKGKITPNTGVNAISGGDKNIAMLIKSIIPLIQSVVTNTMSIESIHQLMIQLVQGKGLSEADSARAAAIISNSARSNSDIDLSLKVLKDTVNKIMQD